MSRQRAIFVTVACVAFVAAFVWYQLSQDRGEPPARVTTSDADAGAAQGAESRRPVAGDAIPGAPFAETPDAAESRAASRPTVEIEVLDGDGKPAAGAKVHAYRGEDVMVVNAVCDAGGVARLDASPGEGDVVVDCPGAVLHHQRLALDAGRRTIRLPRGAAITGWVEVDGQPPKERIPLRLLWADVGDWVDHMPPLVEVHLAGYARRYELATTSDGSGRFRFTGLPDGWSGQLYVSAWGGHSLEGHLRRITGETGLPVTAPAENLVVRLHRWPVLSGRIVASGTRTPVPGAQVRCGVYSETGDSAGPYLRCDAAGRFRQVLAIWRITKITVDAQDAEGLGNGHLERSGPLESDLDLGDIEIGTARTLELVVRDTSGTPIAGAVAATGPNRDIFSEPTDAEGKGRIRIESETPAVRVAAVGYEVAEVPVPPETTGPLLVTLQGGTRLLVRLTSPSGAVPPAVSLVVRIKQPWFGASDVWPERAYAAAGASRAHGYGLSNSRGYEATFEPDEQGRVVLGGIKAGVAIELALRDRLDQLTKVERVTLNAGEAREHVIVVDRPWHALRGVVRDATGAPLSLADVVVLVAMPEIDSRMTDAAGRFGFPAIYSDRVDVKVEKPGYAALLVKDLQLPVKGPDPVFALTPGRRVTVRVADPEGRPVRASSVAAETPGLPPIGPHGTDPSGAIVFDSLPEAKILLRATVAGVEYTKELDTKDLAARIVVPAHGALEARWGFKLEAKSVNRLRVEPASPVGSRLTEFIPNNAEKVGGEAIVPAVLPGDYSIWIEAWVFDPTYEGEEQYHPLSKRIPVTVTAGAVTKATLTP